MKKDIFRIAMAACLLMPSFCAANAQQDQTEAISFTTPRQQRMPRATPDLTARKIAEELELDDSTTTKFIAIYKNYRNEMRIYAPKSTDANRREPGRMTVPTNVTGATAGVNAKSDSKKSGKNIKGSAKKDETIDPKIEKLREKYNKQYSEFLSKEQIDKIYEIEKESRQPRVTLRKVDNEL